MGKTGNTKVAPAAKADSPSSKKQAKVDSIKKKANDGAKKSGGGGKKKDGKSAADSIMEVLAKSHASGKKSVEKGFVLTQTGIAAKTLANTIPKLKTKEWITVEGSTISLTEAGVEKMGDMAKTAASNEEALERLKEGLKPKEIELFDALIDGEVHDKDVVAKDLEYKDGSKTKTFVNAVGRLSGKKIVHYPEKGKIQLNMEMCFPYGK